jgi:hypothetical protein
MSLERFHYALAEARKPVKVKKDYLVKEGDEVFEVNLAMFKEVFKKGTGSKPTRSELAHHKKEPFEIPDLGKIRLAKFRERFSGEIDRTARAKKAKRLKIAVNSPGKIIFGLWKKSPKWRFALAPDDTPAGSYNPLRGVKPEKAEQLKETWLAAIASYRKKKPTALNNLIVIAPDYKESQVAQKQEVIDFLSHLGLLHDRSRKHSRRGPSDKRITRDVLKWVATNKLLYPRLLASRLFTIATPAPIRRMIDEPSEAYTRGKSLVIVPGGDAFGLGPNFWAWTGGPMKNLASLEKKIRLAMKQKAHIDKRLPELEKDIADDTIKKKSDLVIERDNLISEIASVNSLIGKADENGKAINPRTKNPIATSVLNIIQSIQNLLSPIGKRFEVKGPKYGAVKSKNPYESAVGGVRTIMPRGFKSIDKKLPKDLRRSPKLISAEDPEQPKKKVWGPSRLGTLQDPKLRGSPRQERLRALGRESRPISPLQSRLRALGREFRPMGGPDAENFHGRLKAVLGKYVRAKKSIKDSAKEDVKEVEAEVNELQQKFFDSQMAKAKGFADAAKQMKPVNFAWKPFRNAINAYRVIASLYTKMDGMGLPGSKGLKAKAEKASSAGNALQKKAKKAFDADLKNNIKEIQKKFKGDSTREKHTADAEAEANRRWDVMWQGF